jgi:ornithine carbamoyltransferase
MRHFLKDTDFTREEVSQIFGLAARLKRERGKHDKPLAG